MRLDILLTDALADLEACERNPAYEIDMNTWYCDDKDIGICTVCMAGAYLARRHPDVIQYSMYIERIPPELLAILKCINEIRGGHFRSAQCYLHFPDELREELNSRFVEVPEYRPYPEGFKDYIRTVIQISKEFYEAQS